MSQLLAEQQHTDKQRRQPVYDADAHVILSPRMWEGLPAEYAARRPRPIAIGDSQDLGPWTSSWLTDGQLEPRPMGPGTQGMNMPSAVLEEYGARTDEVGAQDLSDPQARLDAMDRLGLDVQVVFPTTGYARMTTDAGFEAALFRCYNRYVAGQCRSSPRRLKWAGLIPLRDPLQGIVAVEEMASLGASAGVVYGTVGEQMLSDRAFTPVWDAFAETGLPLCVHMGRSFPPLDRLGETSLDTHLLGLVLPVFPAFVSIISHGMLDRYPELKVAFLEFGGEWIFYATGRVDHYLPSHSGHPSAVTGRQPLHLASDYLKSGRIFLGNESDDPLMLEEIKLLGEGQILFSSDYPHGEGREDALGELGERQDLTPEQKHKIVYENPVRFFGEP